ncbi:PD-(D/E)XK nuclease family protein [Actinoplanes sp. NBRC 103695]|uniref:PD-(D/E)XK nuclease family protein n=1 Tax=Actinoplanes sp. NBRC 103695 TaxID=3032202 RepID=UPI0024A12983|nr:PD-(D/E)XK nuclease family protein [Actinoplanes sp. NBRC 103695]GLY98774.1 hypothetical protein Acsp02_60280 [Actinoplanes sp. NBRC 103695]
MSTWSRPNGTAGDISLIRINLAAARDNPEDCPLARSTNARPLLDEDPYPPYVAAPLQGFTLKPLMDALDRIEHDGRATSKVIEQLHSTRGTFGLWNRPPAHPGLLEWTAAAISQYLAARAADQYRRQVAGLLPTHPVRYAWVARRTLSKPDFRGVLAYETTAWGRGYVAPDGSARDLWLLSFGAAKPDRPASEKATAAYVAAYGEPCIGGGRHPYQVATFRTEERDQVVPSRVRVIDVGCGDGTTTTLVDWDRHEVDQHFAADAKVVLSRAVGDRNARPGSSCVRCKALSGCDALPRTPNLLSVASSTQPRARRSVSVSDLRTYDACPAQYHLARQLKLKAPRLENGAIRRGRAVDAWLNDRHRDRPAGGCRTALQTIDRSAWMTGTFSLSDDEADQGAKMLAHHEAVCPLAGLGDHEQVLVQHRVSFFEPVANLVWIATPDLLHTRAGGWTWRETKTSTGRLYEGQPLLRQYPQLALAVLILHAGVLGGDVTRSRVELELLNADDVTLEELDPSQPRVVREAHDVLEDLLRPWLQDGSFEPTPGRPCADCEVLAWCSPGQAHLTATAAKPEDR